MSCSSWSSVDLDNDEDSLLDNTTVIAQYHTLWLSICFLCTWWTLFGWDGHLCHVQYV